MLKVDELLLSKTKGKVGSILEDAIEEFKVTDYDTTIYGAILPIDAILVNRDRAKNIILKTIDNYWGDIDLFLHTELEPLNINLENANDRLTSFLHSPQGEKSILDFLHIHNSLQFENLISLIFGKEVKINWPVGGLHKIYLYQIGSKYLIHTISNDHANFWYQLFIKKIYSVFMQSPLEIIKNASQLMWEFKTLVEHQLTLNQSVMIVNNLINYLDNENIRSYQLKELHLFNLISHFNGGKRHSRKVNLLIDNIVLSWGKGKWALSEKEHTLLIYILATSASKHNDYQKVIEYGSYLIEEDRLVNHAIELFVEFSDVLPNYKPEPTTLVKQYDKNYLEQIFYLLIDALIQNKQYADVINLLKKHDIASCTSIYEFFNAEEFDQDLLHKIEATVQRDIAYLIDNSLQHVLQSIDVWLENYLDEKSPYFKTASMTSKHLCNLLKALFATEQYELFEKLMEIYKKYLFIDDHFNDLREFVSQYVKN